MLSSVIGHGKLLSLVSRAIARETLPQALLLAGPAGVGKRRVAVAAAAAVNCLEPRAAGVLERDACGQCPACRRILRGVHPDVIVVEPGDSGSIRIEQVREVIDRSGYRPFEGRRRVVVIDEADALVTQAQNALLKTLEEPPSASSFMLVSSMPDALLSTVRSRCQRLRFGPLDQSEVAAVLTRDHGWEEADARAAASDAGGSVGRALSAAAADVSAARERAQVLLEQTARGGEPVRRLELLRDIAGKRATAAMERAQMAACCRALASMVRDLGLLATGADRRTLANADLMPRLEPLVAAYDGPRSVRVHAATDRALAALERNASPKVVADWLALQL
jgi:DNA polymerase-3 subunit delta'